jgi:hypothetical protein
MQFDTDDEYPTTALCATQGQLEIMPGLNLLKTDLVLVEFEDNN